MRGEPVRGNFRAIALCQCGDAAGACGAAVEACFKQRRVHLEFQDWNPPEADTDIIVLAGDIHSGRRGVEWARRQFPVVPILYVPGNQEFYGRQMHETLSDLQKAVRHCRVDVLHGRGVIIGGVRFPGAALRTGAGVDRAAAAG